MAKYKVTSSAVVEQRKTWIIDAESEDEALDIASESEPKNVQMLYLDVETVWEAKDVTPGD